MTNRPAAETNVVTRRCIRIMLATGDTDDCKILTTYEYNTGEVQTIEVTGRVTELRNDVLEVEASY